MRVWVGTWIGVMCIALVATDASYLVMYITRYTEESFSTLISLIFITDGLKKLLSIYKHSPIDTSWTLNNVVNHNCSCFVPTYSGTVESWFSNFTKSDWVANATSRIILHGKEPHPERFWVDSESYHCIHLTNYTLVDVSTTTEWKNGDTHSCLSHCGVMDGNACPMYRIGQETINSATNQTEMGMLQTAAKHVGFELPDAVAEAFHVKPFGKIYAPDIFLFSLFLAFGTLAISFTLKGTT